MTREKVELLKSLIAEAEEEMAAVIQDYKRG